MSAIIGIIPESAEDEFHNVYFTQQIKVRDNCHKSLAYKLSLMAINMMDHGSGSKRLETHGFLRKVFIVSSFTAYVSAYNFSFCSKASTSVPFIGLYLMTNQIIFWYFIINRSRRMRCLVKDISRAQGIIDKQPSEQSKCLYLVHFLHVITLWVLPTAYPIVLTTIGHLKNENLAVMSKYYCTFMQKEEGYSTIVTIAFLTTLTAAVMFMRDFFAVYFSCICIETKKLISDYHRKLLDETQLDARLLLDECRLIFSIVKEAENMLNIPVMFYFTGSLVSVFFSLATMFDVVKFEETVAYRVSSYIYFVNRAFSYILFTCSAAEVHQEGKRLKKAIKTRTFALDSLFESREGQCLKELIEGSNLGYTGCDVIVLTRSFVLATVGTALTYSVLVLQLQSSNGISLKQ